MKTNTTTRRIAKKIFDKIEGFTQFCDSHTSCYECEYFTKTDNCRDTWLEKVKEEILGDENL